MRPISRPSGTHLAGFKGILQVDGYGGYRVLAERGDVQLAFCWSHARCRFYEPAAAGPAPIASEALERIATLYAIENDIRGRSAEERSVARQEKSRPILDDLEPLMRAKLALISSKLAEASAAISRMLRSSTLESSSMRPSSIKRVSPSQRDSVSALPSRKATQLQMRVLLRFPISISGQSRCC